MPRLLSEDERSDFDDDIVVRAKSESRSRSPTSVKKSRSRKSVEHKDETKDDIVEDPEPESEPEANEENEVEDDLDEDVYVVEAIKSHLFDNGIIKFQVKWEGYDKKSDMTWEAEGNLASAPDIVAEYFEKLGGREAVMGAQESLKQPKKRGRKPAADKEKQTNGSKRLKKDGGSPHPATKSPPPAVWAPPEGNWEDHIKAIDTVYKEGDDRLMVAVTWNAEHKNRKTSHSTQIMYRRCPQKMLKFYEGHLTFKAKDLDDLEMS